MGRMCRTPIDFRRSLTPGGFLFVQESALLPQVPQWVPSCSPESLKAPLWSCQGSFDIRTPTKIQRKNRCFHHVYTLALGHFWTSHFAARSLHGTADELEGPTSLQLRLLLFKFFVALFGSLLFNSPPLVQKRLPRSQKGKL